MYAYLIAEWREWEHRRLGASAVIFALAGALGLSFAYLQPLALGAAGSAASIAAGWISANRFKPDFGQRLILERSALGRPALAGARFLSASASFVLGALVLSPALAMVARAWDIGPASLAAALLVWLGAYLLAMSGAFLSGIAFGRTDRPVGAYALLAWMVPSSLWPPARAFNPFLRASAALARGEAARAAACSLAEIAASGLLVAAAVALADSSRRAKRG